MKKFFLAFVVFISAAAIGRAQFTVDTVSPGNAVSNYLTGPGIISGSVSFQGSIFQQIAAYTYSGSVFPLDTGIMLTTGDFNQQQLDSNASILSATDVGTPGYGLLDAVAGTTTYNAAVLEFDFTPQQNTLSVTYVFGSEEYEEYVGSGFNDVFGFFLSGPNPAGGNYLNENIALIGSTPVSIDNVNQLTNSAYYNSNVSGTYPVVMDGFTVPLTATAPVTPGQVYTIRLALADAGDGIYDSWVFLGFRQFRSLQTTMGLDKWKENDWYLYAGGNGQLYFYTGFAHDGLQLDIIDVNGRTLHQQQLLSPSGYITLPDMAAGIYMARVSDGRQAAVKKFIWR